MAVIHTKRNFVCAYEPIDGDCFVETWVCGEKVDGAPSRRLLLTQTIDQYRAAVDWAVSMAYQMACPIEVVPITGAEYQRLHREAIERMLLSMDDQELGELRQWIVKACAAVLRDCADHEVRADAYDVLVEMKVIRP